MNISSEGRIAISSLVPISPSLTSKIIKTDDFAPPDVPVQATQAELDAQVRRQNAEPVKAVFRINGEVVAAMQSYGTTFFSNAIALPDEGALSVDSVEAALRKRYGSALQVESYPGGNGPTFGMIFAEVYGGKGHLVNTQA
ncbi:MAG: hypothetical protein WC799_20215 [Desulfobacteraceae bacterium]|jgi:hypothetical protein